MGLLAIAWHEPVAGVSLRLSALIDLLGSEAAVAIGRADLLDQLEHLARTDRAHRAANRRYWEQQLPGELARARATASRVCVAMLDLDHFKAASTTAAATRPATACSPSPRSPGARRCGPTTCSPATAARSSASSSRAATSPPRSRWSTACAPITPSGESCSAGIAEWDGSEPVDALVGRADAALYPAKRAGRDRAWSRGGAL